PPKLADIFKGYVGQDCWPWYKESGLVGLNFDSGPAPERRKIVLVGQDFLKFDDEVVVPYCALSWMKAKKPLGVLPVYAVFSIVREFNGLATCATLSDTDSSRRRRPHLFRSRGVTCSGLSSTNWRSGSGCSDRVERRRGQDRQQ